MFNLLLDATIRGSALVSPPFALIIIIAKVEREEIQDLQYQVSTCVPFVFPVSIFAVRAPN